MVTYVYDYPNGGPARFYIEGDYVIPVFGTQPAFGSTGNTGTPILQLATPHLG
jgi:hypothetical protein